MDAASGLTAMPVITTITHPSLARRDVIVRIIHQCRGLAEVGAVQEKLSKGRGTRNCEEERGRKTGTPILIGIPALSGSLFS
jgi:hypothetical protein